MVLILVGAYFGLYFAVHGIRSGPAVKMYAYGAVDAMTEKTYRDAVLSALDFYRGEFGAPPVNIVKIRLYANRNDFAVGLMEFRHVAASTALEEADLGGGFVAAADGTMLINTSRKDVMPEFIVAHELIHLFQFNWAGGETKNISGWIYEGMADYYAAKFIDRLRPGHFQSLPVKKNRALAAVREKPDILNEGFLETDLDWIDAIKKYGLSTSSQYTMAYAISLIAYDFLETQMSKQAILRYFKTLKNEPDRSAAFKDAFGVKLPDFEADLREYVNGL